MPATTPNWDVAFGDLEPLLFQGFLTLQVTVGDVRFLLKTLTPTELKQAHDYLSESPDDPGNIAVQVAFHLFKVNGDNLLPLRKDDPYQVIEFARSLPHVVTRFLLEKAQELSWRVGIVETYLMSYCFLDMSRTKWLTYKDRVLNDPVLTGIPGTEFLGLNSLQESWLAYNRAEDQRSQLEDNWDLATLVASFHNPEAGRKITKHEELRRLNREAFRASYLKGLVAPMSAEEDPDSTEALLKQLAKDMSGVKDDHDKVIEALEMELDQELAAPEPFDWDEKEGFTGGQISEAEFLSLLEAAEGQDDWVDYAYDVSDRHGNALTGSQYRQKVQKLASTRSIIRAGDR